MDIYYDHYWWSGASAVAFQKPLPAYACIFVGLIGLVVVLSRERRDETEKTNPAIFPDLRTYVHGGSNESLSKSEASKILRTGLK
jgi:hypothetical protein